MINLNKKLAATNFFQKILQLFPKRKVNNLILTLISKLKTLCKMYKAKNIQIQSIMQKVRIIRGRELSIKDFADLGFSFDQ